MANDTTSRLPLSTKLILASFAIKFVVDVWVISAHWPDFSRPKLGIAITVPFVIWGLVKQWNWAMCIAGVVCFFWIAFLVARSIAPFLTIGNLDSPFPWSNLLAVPTVILVLNSLRFEDEAGPSKS